MTLDARLTRLETSAKTSPVAATGYQVLIVHGADGRMTDQAYDHRAPGHFILPDNGRDQRNFRIWGDVDYAIDWKAAPDVRKAQIARQRAHLGIPPG